MRKVAAAAAMLVGTTASALLARETAAPVAFVVMDADSGTILAERDAHKRWPPASMAKMMTVLLAMERVRDGALALDTPGRTSAWASRTGGSQAYLPEGGLRGDGERHPQRPLPDRGRARAPHQAGELRRGGASAERELRHLSGRGARPPRSAGRAGAGRGRQRGERQGDGAGRPPRARQARRGQRRGRRGPHTAPASGAGQAPPATRRHRRPPR